MNTTVSATHSDKPSQESGNFKYATHNLCAQCQLIFAKFSLESHCEDRIAQKDPAKQNMSRLHHSTAQDLNRSAGLGCFICASLVQNQKRGGSNRGTDFEKSEWCLQRNEGIITLYLTVLRGYQNFNSPFHVRLVDNPSLYQLGLASLAKSNTRSKQSVDLLRRWLSCCLNNHEACRKNDQPVWYPTRLLDCSRKLVRLVETGSQKMSGPYATMSHCWGRRVFLVLTSENFASFRSGVKTSDFPRSFRDAFVTCRNLGIRYLWIDCYCIVQSGEGSDLDWQRESAKMKDVYFNAILNIGATHASNPSEGLFQHRSPTIQNSSHVTWCPTSSDQEALYRITAEDKLSSHDNFFRNYMLFTRAWIFQERLQATRMAHFTRSELFWECSAEEHTLASEEHPEGILAPRSEENLYPWALKEPSADPKNSNMSLQALWANIVWRYSTLHLTYPEKDKLLALSGVAERMAMLLEDKYVAGMFKKDLVMQLTWRVEFMRRRAPKWRAPSWSWISSDSRIRMPRLLGDATMKVHGIDLELINPDNPFGALKSASLLLLARPLPAILTPESAHHAGVIDPSIMIGEATFSFINDDESELLSTQLPQELYFVLAYVNVRPDRHGMKLEEVLSLRAEHRDQGNNQFQIHVNGLVLRRDDDGHFSRVGVLLDGRDPNMCVFDLWRARQDEVITIV